MLAKLIKYEFRATARILGVLYAALLVIAAVMRIQFTIGKAANMSIMFPAIIVTLLYVAAIVAIGVLTLILIVQRFYKNLLQNEGYLMHTLPVKMWQHISSKLFVSIIWCIISMIIVVISFLIVGTIGVDLGNVFKFATNISVHAIEEYGNTVPNIIAFVLEFIILILAGIAASILHIYLAMAIGQLVDDHKILCSFGAYVGISVVMQIVLGIFTSIFSAAGGHLNTLQVESITAVHMVIWSVILAGIIKSVIFFIATNYLMKNKLNLE
jgi:hypothetical protein